MVIIGIILSLLIGYVVARTDFSRFLDITTILLLFFGGIYVFLGGTHVYHVTQDWGSATQRVMLENNSARGSFQERTIRIINKAPTDMAFIMSGILLIIIAIVVPRFFY